MRSVNTSFLAFLLLAFLFQMAGRAQAVEQTAAPAAVPALEESADDVRLPPGERLLKLLQRIYGVNLGTKANAPLIFAIVVPGSDPCKLFWRKIRAYVFAGRVIVRLFPAGLPNSDDERAAAILLRSTEPLKNWDRYAYGDRMALSGIPDTTSLTKIAVNTAVVDRWQLPVAPYLIYRSRDGQVKVVEGIPASINAMIIDAAHATPETAKP